MNSLTITPVFGGKCDLEYLVGSAHKQPWRPPAANMGPLCLIESCDLRSQETLAASGRKRHIPGFRRVLVGHTIHMYVNIVNNEVFHSIELKKSHRYNWLGKWIIYILRPEAAKVSCDRRSQDSMSHRGPIFAAGGRHGYLWAEPRRFSKSHFPPKTGRIVTLV